jgi:beta-lactamase class A
VRPDLAPVVTRAAADAAAGHGLVSVWVGGLDGRPWAAVDEEEPHYAASTMKLPLAVAAYRLHERGVLDLAAPVRVHADFGSARPGARFSMDEAYDQDPLTWAEVGGECVLGELLRRSIVLSGNLATNLLLEAVGTAEVAAVLADVGASARTRVERGIEDAPAREAGLDNTVTARDLGLLLAAVGDRHAASPACCRALEDVLAAQTYRDGVPAGLPGTTYVANKTGWVDGVHHDAALVRPEGRDPFVLVVLTRLDVAHDRAAAAIAGVARAVWEAL